MKIGRGRIIDDDLFFVARRLKGIDSGYFIFFNYVTKKFELHNKNQRGNTLSLVLPFDRLDERTVNLTLYTRAERKQKIFAELARHNEKLEKQKLYERIKKCEQEVENEFSKL